MAQIIVAPAEEIRPVAVFDVGAGQGHQGNRLRTALGTESYRYDAQGRRVRTASTAGTLYEMYSLDGKLLWQRDEQLGLRFQHVYLGGSLVASQRLEIGGTGISVTYRHTDALGSPIAATDAAGSVVQTTEHEPYGRMLNRTNDNRPGYTGHVMDQATGLVYMQQRYYDPMLGKMLSVDPVTAYEQPITNFCRYCYARNNPYRFIDPDGRQSLPNWPVQNNYELNKADKPREGRGEFGTPRNTSLGPSTHSGIDIQARTGTPVLAAGDGVVVDVRPNPSATYGNQIVIDHGEGVYTQSSHLDGAIVGPGDNVLAGQMIGTVGTTGNTPPAGDAHLHFEVRIGGPEPRARGGSVVDPSNVLPPPPPLERRIIPFTDFPGQR